MTAESKHGTLSFRTGRKELEVCAPMEVSCHASDQCPMQLLSEFDRSHSDLHTRNNKTVDQYKIMQHWKQSREKTVDQYKIMQRWKQSREKTVDQYKLCNIGNNLGKNSSSI